MAKVNVTISLDADLLQDFQRLCDAAGISVADALTIFMEQSVRANRILLDFPENPLNSLTNTKELKK